ncbi:hypothetical protein ACFLS1_11220 [Verrucomicrobiota bacterium]
MRELIDIIIIIGMILFTPAILAVWFFGLRPFVARHGRARITAANWGLSMWADWTTAYEIGKETGNKSWAARLFLALWLLWVCFFVILFILGNL